MSKAVKFDEVKQYVCRLPACGYAIEVLWRGKRCGFYPLTEPFPTIYATRKEAMTHTMHHERVVRVTVSRRSSRLAGRGKK